MTEYSDDQITSKGQQKREDNALQELGLLLICLLYTSDAADE